MNSVCRRAIQYKCIEVLASLAALSIAGCNAERETPIALADSGKDAASEGSSSANETGTVRATISLSVDSWNVGLYGNNSPYADQRTGPIASTIAARSSDIICLTEVDAKADRNAIIAAAKTNFPYSYQVDTDNTTPFDDAAQADGAAPQVPTTPACASVPSNTLSPAYACVEQNCSAADAGAGSLPVATGCLSQECINSFFTFYKTNIQDDRCFDCFVINANDPTESYQTNQQLCTTSTSPTFAYQGQTPLLILSKYPITNPKSYMLPSTGFRRGILKAQIGPQGHAADFFCGQLDTEEVNSIVPYTGSYGSTSLDGDANGWADEQLLQAERAVAWIKQEVATDNVPGIVAGSFASTVGTQGSTASTSLVDLNPGVMQLLDKSVGGAFVRAEPSGYVRTCDRCPDNPFVSTDPAEEFSPLLLANFSNASTATVSETLWATDVAALTFTAEPYQPLTELPDGGTGPLSAYYAHNNVILVP